MELLAEISGDAWMLAGVTVFIFVFGLLCSTGSIVFWIGRKIGKMDEKVQGIRSDLEKHEKHEEHQAEVMWREIHKKANA